MVEKYFELQYWANIIGIIMAIAFVLIVSIWCLISIIVYEYRKKSKNWQYNRITRKWEKVE